VSLVLRRIIWPDGQPSADPEDYSVLAEGKAVAASIGDRNHRLLPIRPTNYAAILMIPKRKIDNDRRRALSLLAGSPNGHNEAIMRAHGFTPDLLADLVRAGLATSHVERVGRRRPIEVVRLRITKLGWKALA
jgi:hypothetical protein